MIHTATIYRVEAFEDYEEADCYFVSLDGDRWLGVTNLPEPTDDEEQTHRNVEELFGVRENESGEKMLYIKSDTGFLHSFAERYSQADGDKIAFGTFPPS